MKVSTLRFVVALFEFALALANTFVWLRDSHWLNLALAVLCMGTAVFCFVMGLLAES
jgi:hypothetical protein